MRNRFIQYAGLFVGALLAWCRLGSAATGAGSLDLRPAIRPGGLPTDSCDHGTSLQRDDGQDHGLQPVTPDADCPLVAWPAAQFGWNASSVRLASQSDFTPVSILSLIERLDSGPPR